MTKLFAKPAAILDEIRKLKKAEKFRREDRAIVSQFFNGAPPLTDQEASDLGFTVNVNHLFGFKELTDASDQVFGLYTKPETILTIELDAAPPGKAALWGMEASTEASRVLKKILRFKSHYQGICGDGTMHGEACFFFPDQTFPLPRQAPLSRLLIPDDATTDVHELTHFDIEAPFNLRDLRKYYTLGAKGWNKANLGKVLSKIYEGKLEGTDIDQTNLEEVEYRRQQNSATGPGERRRPGVDVNYFYQVRTDRPGNPFDLVISLNYEDSDSEEDYPTKILYEGECVIPSITKCLHPLFMDCIIGGAPKWHRVLGLGPLNYQINHAVELLVNRAMQATVEGSMNLWQASGSTTRDAAERILMKHNGILPEGLTLLNERFKPDFNGILEMIQFFRQAGSKNAAGVTPNNGQKNDQLEVQALQEMNQGATNTNNRVSNWYDYKDRMYTEAFARLTNCYIDKQDPGYSEVMDFQNAMQRRGIPLHYLQSANVSVRCVRLVGDGLRQKEMAAVQYLTANRANFAPEVQPKITRICTGLALDNYRLAEELTPIQEEPDSPQIVRAEDENAVLLTMRKPLKPKVDDIDEIHVMQHFPALELLISDALQFQKAAFTPPQAQAFQVIGGHIVTHIKRVEARAVNQKDDPNRDRAKSFMEHLNAMAAMGEKLVKNMEQTQGQQQQEVDPVEMAKLQLQAQALELQRDKMNHSVMKFERTQGFREQASSFEQVLKLEKDRREAIASKRDAARGDVETALKVATAAGSGQ